MFVNIYATYKLLSTTHVLYQYKLMFNALQTNDQNNSLITCLHLAFPNLLCIYENQPLVSLSLLLPVPVHLESEKTN